MWEVFAFTSLIFAALGMMEYKKSQRRYSLPTVKPREEVRIKQPNFETEVEEPQKFIKLRFSEEQKLPQPSQEVNVEKPSVFSSPKDKEEAKRIWENHYIVKAVKERFAKKEERNYGVFTEPSQPAQHSAPPSNSFNTFSYHASSSSDAHSSTSSDQVSPSSLLPALPLSQTEPSSQQFKSEESKEQQTLPGGVFGSLLQERQNSELKLVNEDMNEHKVEQQNMEKKEESSSEEKKGEEFNPFDVLGRGF